jgi:hypothetical protein
LHEPDIHLLNQIRYEVLNIVVDMAEVERAHHVHEDEALEAPLKLMPQLAVCQPFSTVADQVRCGYFAGPSPTEPPNVVRHIQWLNP